MVLLLSRCVGIPPRRAAPRRAAGGRAAGRGGRRRPHNPSAPPCLQSAAGPPCRTAPAQRGRYHLSWQGGTGKDGGTPWSYEGWYEVGVQASPAIGQSSCSGRRQQLDRSGEEGGQPSVVPSATPPPHYVGSPGRPLSAHLWSGKLHRYRGGGGSTTSKGAPPISDGAKPLHVRRGRNTTTSRPASPTLGTAHCACTPSPWRH